MPENAETQAVVSLEQLKQIPPAKLAKLIDKVREKLKTSQTIIDMFQEYEVDLAEIDLIPICFSELEVSARTEHGIIYLNYSLLSDGDFENDDHYLAHEIDHFLQQTTGSQPTQGSTDDSYLDNEFEQEGFQTQTKYLSETKGDEAAEQYVDKVLDHHEVEGKERKEKRKELLQLAAFRSMKKRASLDLKTQFNGLIGIADVEDISSIQETEYYNLMMASRPYYYYSINYPTFDECIEYFKNKTFRLLNSIYSMRKLGFSELESSLRSITDFTPAHRRDMDESFQNKFLAMDETVSETFRKAEEIVGSIDFKGTSQPQEGALFTKMDEEYFDTRKISASLAEIYSAVALSLSSMAKELSLSVVAAQLTDLSANLATIKTRLRQLHWSDVQKLQETMDEEHQEDPEMLELALRGEYH
jgi:hypothetical protein